VAETGGRKRKRKIYREAGIQKRAVAWFRATHPDKILIHINNNSPGPAAAVRNRALGVTAGFPDLFLFYPVGIHNGLAIELKAPGRKPRPEQLQIHDRLSVCGYLVLVVRSFDSFKRVVTDYLGG